MRKYHRWLAVIFGIFLFWIALTGFGIQIVTLTQGGDHDEQEEHEASAAAKLGGAGSFALITPALAHGDEEHEAPTPTDLQAAGAPAGFACPAGWSCRPPITHEQHEANEALEFVMHLHSGEAFGPVGTWISIASALALLFFSFSGLWMYVQMWRARGRGGAKRAMFW